VYEQMGNTSGSSVALKVFLAFVLPPVIFIAVLAVSQRILSGVAEPARTAISLVLALASAFGWILTARAICRKSC
jgi:hypothetical protein